MNERLQYAIRRLETEPRARVYETGDPDDIKRGSGQYAVYPSIWPQPMHYLDKRDMAYLLKHEWIIPAGQYWFERGPRALVYAPNNVSSTGGSHG